MPVGQQHISRLTPEASHGDVQRHVSGFLEEVLDWELETEVNTQTGAIDSLPIGPSDNALPVFIIEYKSGSSESLDDLENKKGSRDEETALEQLVRYMTTEKMTLFGILADASRLAVYANTTSDESASSSLHIEFDDLSRDDIKSIRARLPLSTDTEYQLEVPSQEEFVDFLADSIEIIRDPLISILERYDPEEYDVLKNLMPVGTSINEFANKTAASLVSKLLLIRAMEGNNGSFGAIINPEIAKSFGSSEYGFIALAHSAYELAGTKFPHVFKSDIDVFDWWFPGNIISPERADLKDEFSDLNSRLFNVLQRMWAFDINIDRDLMGLVYQKLRPESESTILGAYFTSPGLTESTIDALQLYLDKEYVSLDKSDIFDAHSNEHSIIDCTCGSGTFLVSLASRAIENTNRAPEDCARALISRIHGVDIDPLAVLMARSQLFGVLAEHLETSLAPHIYWQNTLQLLDPPDRQLAFFEDHESVGTAIEEAKHDTQESRQRITPNSFSLVIGNPPWGRRSQIGRRMREAGISDDEVESRLDELVTGSWADWFDSRDDNLLTPFVDIGSKLLSHSGILALILDARFISTEWGERSIDILENEFSNVRILNISESDEFSNSASYPSIVLAEKN